MPIWTAMTAWRSYALAVAAGALLFATVYGAVRFYGHAQYVAGQADERARAERQQAAIERGMQEERDRADAQYRGAVLARENADRLVADQRKRIDGLLAQLRNRPAATGAVSGPDDAGADWIGIFGQCVAEYERMGKEAGRLADKVGGLQGYVRGVMSGLSIK